jgi:hypothetical protein
MARLCLLFHPTGTRVFSVRDGEAVAFEVKGIRIDAEQLARGEADHPVAEEGAAEAPVPDLAVLPYGALFASAEEALLDHAAIAEGRMVRPRIESQASTAEWTGACYADEVGDRTKKVMNLIEEVAELATEAGIDPEVSTSHFRKSADRPRSDGDADKAVHKEIGDVGIAYYDLGAAYGVDADGCRDRAMAVNRTRSPEECAARVARKRGMGL